MTNRPFPLLKKFFLPSVILLFAIKCVFLNADPPVFKQPGNLHDEAWWANNARLKILTGHWQVNAFSGGIAVAPLNSFITYYFFKASGINFTALRCMPLAASLFSLLVIYFFLRRKNEQVAQTAVLLLSINYTFFCSSRLAQLEMGMSLFLITALLLLMQSGFRSLLFASVILFLGVLYKFSAIIYYPAFMAVLIAMIAVQKRTVKHLVFFTASQIILFFAFRLLYYRFHEEDFSLYMEHARSIMPLFSTSTFSEIIQRIIFLPQNDFFTEPGVCIIMMLALPALIFRSDDVSCQSQQETISWLRIFFMVTVLMLVVLDVNPRRFFPLLIPLVTLASYSVVFPISKNNLAFAHPLIMLPAITFLLLPAAGLHMPLHLAQLLPQSWIEGCDLILINKKLNLVIGSIIILLIFLFCLTKFFRTKKAFSMNISIWIFLSIMLYYVILNLASKFFILPGNRIVMFTFALCFFSAWSIFGNRKKTIFILLVCYGASFLSFLSYDFLHCTFTRQHAAGEMKALAGAKKDYAIFFRNGWDASMETQLLPLNYTVEDIYTYPLKSFSDLTKKPSWFISSISDRDSILFKEELNFVLKKFDAQPVLLNSIPLFPAFHSKHRETLFIYALNYR